MSATSSTLVQWNYGLKLNFPTSQPTCSSPQVATPKSNSGLTKAWMPTQIGGVRRIFVGKATQQDSHRKGSFFPQ